MRFLLILGLITASSTAAFADGDQHAAPVVASERDPGAALQLSIAGSVIPLGLFASGLDERGTPRIMLMSLAVGVVTPSLGEIYAGRYVTYGMAARAAGFALTMIGGKKFQPVCWEAFCSEVENQRAKEMMLGGLIVYAGGMIYDVATAPRTAHRYNERHVAIAPLLGPSNGIALTGQF